MGRPKGSKDSRKRKQGSGRRAGGAAKASKSTGGGPNVPSEAAPARAPTAKRPPPLQPEGREWAERLINAFPGSPAAKQKSTAQVQTGLGEHPDLRPLVDALEKRPAGFHFQSVPDGGAIDRTKTRAAVLLRERQTGRDTPAASAAAGGGGAVLAGGVVDAPSVGAQSALAGTAPGAALVTCGAARTCRPFLPSR